MSLKTVYQTLENREDNDLDKLESNGPYKCCAENTWLGDGYYFWDTFVENAHWWGEVRKYPKGYIICKAICDFNDEDCLDLQGNMEHLKFFKDSFELSKSKGKVDNSTTIKKFLAFMKGENKAFNFSAIRVNGVKSKSINSPFGLNLFFEEKKEQYFELIPAVQICFFSKTSLNLRNFKIIFPVEYADGYVV